MDLEVRRDDLAATQLVDRLEPEPNEGQALLRIDRFGLSTNNITFGVTGDLLGYWKLFPASAPEWGRVPVFGFADVIASRHPGVAVGMRVFGYLPMSHHLLVEPARPDARGFLDGAAHRRDVMATVWNHYQDVTDLAGDADADARRSLLRPLFVTGFLIDDFLADNDAFGADTIVISSASAKTAIATAHCMAQRGDRRVVGLTSPGRVGFVTSLGIYDDVLPYDEAASVPGERAAFVDIAGLLPARDAIHDRFEDGLCHSMTVGLSNVPDPARILAPPPETGPAPEVFYAQLQVAKRAADWGQVVFDQRLETAWDAFTAFTRTWLTIESAAGPDAVRDAWLAMLSGDIDAAVGLDLSLWDAA